MPPRDPDDVWRDIFGTTGICTPSRKCNPTERRERTTEDRPQRVDNDRDNVFTRQEQEKEKVQK